MLFNSYEFIFGFLPLTLIVFFAIGARAPRLAIAWLVGASLAFYAYWNPSYIALVLASIAFNYTIGLSLSRSATRWRLVLGVGGNLALLGYFKYANFLVENLDRLAGVGLHLDSILLPLAISFFTFQQIAFLVDAYRQKTRSQDFLHYCLFVAFFPQLIAGPIVHHAEMLPQFRSETILRPRARNLAVGATIFAIGLFKKVVIADGVALYATPVFAGAEQGVVVGFFEAWSAALAYTLQLYYDFSGYCDMAIGLGALFGIRLPLNFNSPYKARNIIDFWRRWHMTLSRFLRDYLYIPLGGNRRGAARRYTNIALTMVLGGLWHGAAWTFVLWGALHGVYVLVNHGWHVLRRSAGLAGTWPGGLIAARLITFVAVVVAWVLFRAESVSSAANLLAAMSGADGFALPDGAAAAELGQSAWVLLALLLHVWFAPNVAQMLSGHSPVLETYTGEVEPARTPALIWRPSLPWALLTAMLASIALVFLVRESEFLYFQF